MSRDEDTFIADLRLAAHAVRSNAENGALSPSVRDYMALATLLDEAANRTQWRERHIMQAEINIAQIRSLIHNLPRSATAEQIDTICADALGEEKTP